MDWLIDEFGAGIEELKIPSEREWSLVCFRYDWRRFCAYRIDQRIVVLSPNLRNFGVPLMSVITQFEDFSCAS